MLPGREARIAIRGPCHRWLEVCPIADRERRPADRRIRKQSKATNLVQRKIQQVLGAGPKWTKRFQLPSPPKFQAARTQTRRTCPDRPPCWTCAPACLSNRRQKSQEGSRRTP